MNDKKIIEAKIELLNKLNYTNAYTGSLGKLEQKSYVLYSDILKEINLLKEELKKI